MKEWTASVIGIMFALALIIFTGMEILPIEVFCSVSAGAIVWFFKEKEAETMYRRLQGK